MQEVITRLQVTTVYVTSIEYKSSNSMSRSETVRIASMGNGIIKYYSQLKNIRGVKIKRKQTEMGILGPCIEIRETLMMLHF